VALHPMTTDAASLPGLDRPLCLAVLEDYLRRPGWQLTLASGVSGCMGDDSRATLTLDASGDASWTGGGLPARPLHLTPVQIAQLHEAAALSCERPAADEGGFASWYVDVHWGSAEAPARRVRESPAQAQLDAFIADAVTQYQYRRLAERADFHATVKLEPYQVMGVSRPMTISFDGRGTLTVRVGRRSVTAEDLDIATRVNAIDWIEMGGPTVLPIPYSLRMALDRATYDAGMQND